jgi:hypothetical protein
MRVRAPEPHYVNSGFLQAFKEAIINAREKESITKEKNSCPAHR